MHWGDQRAKSIRDIGSSKEFMLTAVGLIFFDALLIPIVFSQIENRHKELEIATDLIKEMSAAVMNPIGILRVFDQGIRNDTEINLTDSRSEIMVLTGERIKNIQTVRLIESELRAYFRDTTSIARDWNNIFTTANNL